MEDPKKFSIPRLGIEGALPEMYEPPVVVIPEEILIQVEPVEFSVPRLGWREVFTETQTRSHGRNIKSNLVLPSLLLELQARRLIEVADLKDSLYGDNN